MNATITVSNWKDGNLGINLGTQTKKIDTNAFVVANRLNDQGQTIPEAGFFGESQYWVHTGTVVSRSLDAGAGNDLVGGSSSADTITGGAGHDFIAGGGGKDVLIGGDGYDWIIADIKARPNGGLDENGQYKEPPEGYTNAGIYSDTGDQNKFQGYGWALYTKASSAGITTHGPTDGIVQSGDTSDVFIDGGGGTDNIFGSAGNDLLLTGSGKTNDQASGGYGNDVLMGNEGKNILNGDLMYFDGF
ncbi:MAG: hypothetical protein HC767_03540 [Akkermansiaceae bacterium]|nr:hypothetical protein [Akkermansiaceae bacterium]